MSGFEDLLLGEETGGERNGDQRGETDEKGQAGDWHFLQKTAHVPDVLLVVASVDDGAGTEEEQSLEPGVGEEVEHARLAVDEADGHHHVAELGKGRVGEHALDVVLLGGHQCGDERGDSASPGDDVAGLEAFEVFKAEGELQAEEHVNARRDHGGGVDQSGNGGRAFHGVGQPDVERELGGLADGTAEDEEHGGRKYAAEDRGIGGVEGIEAAFHRVESEAARDSPQHEDADHETEVADAVAEEGFFRRIRRGVFLVPVTDEQVGAKSDQLPEDEGHDEVVRQHDAGHRKHEQRQTREVAGLRLVVLHVGEREDVN